MFKSAFFFLLFSTFIFAQDSNRYTDSLFNYTQVVSDGFYANAPEVNTPYQGQSLTHNEELKFHLFAPENDTLKLRPLLICIHGGGFVSGNKDHDDMLEFCKIFASRGYVTTTIQYRLGMSFFSNISGERAVYRGLQDGRAAIRYFKENFNVYGIDTNNVYLIGSSAGAFVSLHNLFMNEESERPAGTYEISNSPPTTNDGPDLGTLDAINPTLKHGSHPNGVISLWGAIKNIDLIKESDGTIPIFLVHGTDDSTVPFDVGHPFGLPTVQETYGSKPINEKLISLGYNNDTYFVPGEDHEFYGVSNGMWSPAPNAYWDTVVTKSTDFLWGFHKPIAKGGHDYYGVGDVITFTDSSEGATKWEWAFGDGETSTLQNPSHQYAEWGTYITKLKVYNHIDSWDTTSIVVHYIHVSVDEKEILPTKFELSQNYPNPFNPSTTIKYSIPINVNSESAAISLVVYNMLGQVVATLVTQNQMAGNYEVKFDASNLTSGIYFYQLTSSSTGLATFAAAKKLLLLK
jgi:acetyl esterase/lipase